MACALASVAGTPSLRKDPFMSSTRISPSTSRPMPVNALPSSAGLGTWSGAAHRTQRQMRDPYKPHMGRQQHLSMRGSFSSIIARNSSHLRHWQLVMTVANPRSSCRTGGSAAIDGTGPHATKEGLKQPQRAEPACGILLRT